MSVMQCMCILVFSVIDIYGTIHVGSAYWALRHTHAPWRRLPRHDVLRAALAYAAVAAVEQRVRPRLHHAHRALLALQMRPGWYSVLGASLLLLREGLGQQRLSLLL